MSSCEGCAYWDGNSCMIWVSSSEPCGKPVLFEHSKEKYNVVSMRKTGENTSHMASLESSLRQMKLSQNAYNRAKRIEEDEAER